MRRRAKLGPRTRGRASARRVPARSARRKITTVEDRPHLVDLTGTADHDAGRSLIKGLGRQIGHRCRDPNEGGDPAQVGDLAGSREVGLWCRDPVLPIDDDEVEARRRRRLQRRFGMGAADEHPVHGSPGPKPSNHPAGRRAAREAATRSTRASWSHGCSAV